MSLALSTVYKMYPYIHKFDITMSSGLKSIPKIYTLDEKKTILNNIMSTYNPHSLEIGSLISPRLVRQMSNSYELYNYANNLYNAPKPINTQYLTNYQNQNVCDFYLLVPPTKEYIDIAKKLNIRNISIITSVSQQFYKKSKNTNTNKHQSIEETKTIIKDSLKIPNSFDNVKIYLSCVTNCPIEGQMDKKHIIEEVYDYLHIDGISEVCLSDTCGNMKYSDFTYIIDNLNIKLNFNLDRIGLDLHINYNDETKYYILDKIIEYATNNNIYRFNVSSFENIYFCNGHVTIDVSTFNNNITYDRIYEALFNNYNKYT